ncbi:MAG: cation:proton antiporter, partial [Actinobacteria bacterium]|nr:cation:proton antiporter [Actinomycetota bacterium]
MNLTVVIFGALLLISVLLSEIAHRTVLSLAVLFLVAGFVLGGGGVGVMSFDTKDPAVGLIAELALFSILFTDGMKAGLSQIRSIWGLPGRALLLGMPICFGLISISARLVVDMPWAHCFLIGAILTPTDPVFASAIIARDEVPSRLRHLLNVESGLNDGLALPVVVILLGIASGKHPRPLHEASELFAGLLLGLLIPLAA